MLNYPERFHFSEEGPEQTDCFTYVHTGPAPVSGQSPGSPDTVSAPAPVTSPVRFACLFVCNQLYLTYCTEALGL